METGSGEGRETTDPNPGSGASGLTKSMTLEIEEGI
jgi:hypothetical protein